MTPDYPARIRSAPPAALVKLLDAAADARPYRVLILEDSPDTRTAIARLLSAPCRRITCAATMAEAFVEVAKAPPDVLLCDLALPDGNGENLLAALPGVPTLVMSGTSDDDAIARVRGRAGCVFMRKPVSFADVRGWVEGVERTVRR